jgi:hypothetical protein
VVVNGGANIKKLKKVRFGIHTIQSAALSGKGNIINPRWQPN